MRNYYQAEIDMGGTVLFEVGPVTLLVSEYRGVAGNLPDVYEFSSDVAVFGDVIHTTAIDHKFANTVFTPHPHRYDIFQACTPTSAFFDMQSPWPTRGDLPAQRPGSASPTPLVPAHCRTRGIAWCEALRPLAFGYGAHNDWHGFS